MMWLLPAGSFTNASWSGPSLNVFEPVMVTGPATGGEKPASADSPMATTTTNPSDSTVRRTKAPSRRTGGNLVHHARSVSGLRCGSVAARQADHVLAAVDGVGDVGEGVDLVDGALDGDGHRRHQGGGEALPL